MPTIDELAPASSASDSDEMLVSQAGITRKVTRAQMLNGVQPQLAVPGGSLLGNSGSNIGVPEIITVGDNLTFNGTTLSAAAVPFVIDRLASGTVPDTADLVAMSQVRPLKRCRIASRNIEHAQKFGEEMQPAFSFPLEPVATVAEALKDADLIVTVTAAVDPIVRREWIGVGAHLNLVGSSTPNAREVDSETMAAVSLFVDRRESTINEAGDYLLAVRDGLIGADHIRAEVGEVLRGDKPGRTSAVEITCFKSLGLAIEDLAAAVYLYKKAREQSVGSWVEF